MPRALINMAGKLDLSEAIEAYEAGCGEPVVRQLLGGMPAAVPVRYADTSIQRLARIGVQQVLIWGSLENYVPLSQADAFAMQAREVGDDARVIVIPNAGRFEIASPRSKAWPTVLGTIKALLGS